MNTILNFITSLKTDVVIIIIGLLFAIGIGYKVYDMLSTIERLREDNTMLKKNIDTIKDELAYEKLKHKRDEQMVNYKKKLNKEVKDDIYQQEESEDSYEILATDRNESSTDINISRLFF